MATNTLLSLGVQSSRFGEIIAGGRQQKRENELADLQVQRQGRADQRQEEALQINKANSERQVEKDTLALIAQQKKDAEVSYLDTVTEYDVMLKNGNHGEVQALAAKRRTDLLAKVEQNPSLAPLVEFNNTVATGLGNAPKDIEQMVAQAQEVSVAQGKREAIDKGVQAQSPAGKVVADFNSGLLNKDQLDAALKPKQSTSEFERILANSGLSSAEKADLTEQRLDKLVGGDAGMALMVDKDGETVLVSGGAAELTKAQRGKAIDEFQNRTVAARRFAKLSNSVLKGVEKRAGQIGVVGAITRMGDELQSIASNVSTEFGVDVSEVSENIEDYNLGGLANASAEFQTNMFSLALIFASASGLGEGRALTDKDVQRAIDAIGGGTNSFGQLSSRLRAIQTNMLDDLTITADVKKFEFGGIPELDAPSDNTSIADQSDPNKGFSSTKEARLQELLNKRQQGTLDGTN